MDLKQIRELMTAMERAGIKKLTIKQKGGDEVHLERQEESPSHPQPSIVTFYPPGQSHPREIDSPGRHLVQQSKSHHEEAQVAKEVKEEKPGKHVTSPLVGTFYASSSPDSPPFVKVGDRVNESTVICIIEAMKVMNEVKAGISGTVAEILVENAQPVEFGTKLIRIV